MIKTKLYNTVLVYTTLCLSISTTVIASNNDNKSKIQRGYTVLNINKNTNSNNDSIPRQVNNEDKKEVQLKEYKQENEDLKQQVEDLITSKNEFKVEADNKQIEINDLTEKKNKIEREFEEVKKDNEDIQEENKELALQVQQLKDDLNFCNSQKNSLDFTNKRLLQNIEQLQQKFSQKNDSTGLFINSSIERGTYNPNGELRKLQTEIQTLISKNKGLTDQYDLLSQKNKKLTQENKRLKDEKNSLVNDFNTERERLESDKSDIAKGYNDLLNEYNCLKQSYEEEQKINKLNNDISRQRELKTQNTRKVRFRDEISTQDDEIKDNAFGYNMSRRRTRSIGSDHYIESLASLYSNPPSFNKSDNVKLAIENRVVEQIIVSSQESKKDQNKIRPKGKNSVAKQEYELKVGLGVTIMYSVITTGLLLARTKQPPAEEKGKKIRRSAGEISMVPHEEGKNVALTLTL